MTARTVLPVAFYGRCKDRDKQFATITTLSESEIHRPNVVLSLACCPVDAEVNSNICSKKDASASTSPSHGLGCKNQFAADKAREHTVNEAMKGEFCTQEEQDGDVGRAMMEEFTSSVVGLSEKGRDPKREKIERGLRVVAGSNGESNGCGNLRRYLMSMEYAGKLPSSQYKGVVPQPNGRWGAQIYEKHQRVWLGTFNREEDAARAYDRAALKFRGREAIINFCPGRGGDLEDRFMSEFNKEAIVDMLRKHTYDEELEYHGKRIMMAAARSVAMKNAEASGSEGSGRREIFCQEDQAASEGNPNAVTSGAAMAGLSREHLFDKAVTPSDVGKLIRMVIPKNHAEKYFPVDVNTHDKGLLLSFEDDTGKGWRFRYSYWKSSQSYVLTKGWSRFVKEKKLEAGDIVSFHREVARPCKFYISWRRKSLRQLRLADGPPSHQSKGAWRYPSSILSSLNPFDSEAQASVVYNAQWMPPLNKRVGHVVAEWSQSPATRLNGVFPFYCSEPPTKPTYKSSFYDINQNLHSSLKSGDECAKIRSLYPLVNPPRPPAVQELATPEHKAASSVHPTAKKGVRLFGMTLVEP